MLAQLQRRMLRDPVFGYILVAPLMLWLVVTLFYPLVRAVVVSFLGIDYFGQSGSFVGFENYARLVRTEDFHMPFLRSLLWTTANVAVQFLLAFGSALVLDMDFFGKKFLRNWIITPWVIPVIVIAVIWRWMLDPTFGVVNFLLQQSGLLSEPIAFLGSVNIAMISAIIINSWRWFPFYAIILLASLQTVPRDLYEAAWVDGARRIQRFVHITVPTIAPVMLVVILISSLWAVNVFDMLWLLTEGGPGSVTTTLPIWIYEKAFSDFRLAQASAMAVLMFLILLVYGSLYLRRLSPDEK